MGKKFQALQQNYWIKLHTSENNFSISNDIFNVIWNLQHEMSCWCSCKSCGFVSGWFNVISQTDGFRFWAWTTELSSVWTSGWGHISGSHDNITSKTTEINSRVCSILAGPSLRFGPDNFNSSKQVKKIKKKAEQFRTTASKSFENSFLKNGK